MNHHILAIVFAMGTAGCSAMFVDEPPDDYSPAGERARWSEFWREVP